MLGAILMHSCNIGAKNDNNVTKKDSSCQKVEFPQAISIYKFGTFSNITAKHLQKNLMEYHPKVLLKSESLKLPQRYYLKERNRYLGTGLFAQLDSIRKDKVNTEAIIGLTNYVIYKPNDISPTFGIMGVSPINKYICVVSSIIPRDGKTQSDDVLCKLALHELGHAFGLPHCKDEKCFMVDAEHKMKFHNTPGFCDACKKKLNAKGWTIK